MCDDENVHSETSLYMTLYMYWLPMAENQWLYNREAAAL